MPAITTMPGCPSVAPYKAISPSVTNSICFIPSVALNASRIRARMSFRLTPASPIPMAAISCRLIEAALHALSTASRTAVAAVAIPTRRGFDGPAVPSPSTRCSLSRTTARVFEPPPSTPTTKSRVRSGGRGRSTGGGLADM